MTKTAPPPATQRQDQRGPVSAGVIAVVFSGAIFGFFYAWVCSTMWGLDDADPRVAIEAMQAMNASVRNFVFAPAFFGTPFVLAGVALYARRRGSLTAAKWYGAAAVIYTVGAMFLTLAINVPMNQDLAEVAVPDNIDAARQIWADYSPRWQRWNITRTVFSGIALVAATLGMFSDRPERSAI